MLSWKGVLLSFLSEITFILFLLNNPYHQIGSHIDHDLKLDDLVDVGELGLPLWPTRQVGSQSVLISRLTI